MANGFYMSQYQPMDYRGLIAGAGAPLSGLMGGVQEGVQLAGQIEEMRAARQQREMEQQRAQQQAGQQEEMQALSMQAAQGDPEAQQMLMALDPKAAMQMQQVINLQQQQGIAAEKAEKEASGAMGSLLLSGKKDMVRATYERAVARIRKEGDSEEELGLPNREVAKAMSDDELYNTIQGVGGQLEAYALGPEEAAEIRMRKAELGEKRTARMAKAAEKGDVSALPPIKDPGTGRKEFTGLSKDFRQVADSYRRIQAAGQNPSAAGDIALIFNYMKMLDPGSVVREGEFATAQNAASVPERIRAQYNRVKSGERLTDSTRTDFLNQADNQLKPAIKSQERREETFKKLAKKSGYDPEDIVIDFMGEMRPKKGKGAGKTAVETRTLPDGRVMVKYSDGTLGVQ